MFQSKAQAFLIFVELTLNTIRTRAGLDSLAADSMSQQDVLDAVMEERHKEFFGEMGHRFLRFAAHG